MDRETGIVPVSLYFAALFGRGWRRGREVVHLDRAVIQHRQPVSIGRQRKVSPGAYDRLYQQSNPQAAGAAVQHAQHLVLHVFVIDGFAGPTRDG